MSRNLKIFWLLSLFSLKTTLQHRTGIIFFILGKAIRFGMFFLFIYYLLVNTRLLAGYTLAQTLVFYLTFNIIDTLAQLLFREVYRFRSLVVAGELDSVLVKPYHPLLRVLLGGVDLMDAIMLVPYTLLLSYFIVSAGVLAGLNILFYVMLIGNALLIAAGFHIFVLVLGILTTEVDHTIMIYRDITRMAILPIDIYREPVRTLITFVIPVGVMMTFPSRALFNLLSPAAVAVSFAIGLVVFSFSLLAWRGALRKYQSYGG